MLKQFEKWVKTTPSLQILALIFSGPAVTALVVYVLSAVIFAAWTGPQGSLQLQILRETVAYSFVILLVIIGALTAGLVRGFKVGVGKVTAEVDLADEHDDEEVKARVIDAEMRRSREMSEYGSYGRQSIDNSGMMREKYGDEIVEEELQAPEDNDLQIPDTPTSWDEIK